MTTTLPAIRGVAPWFGSNRMLAEHVGRLVGKRAWVGIPFAGSMTEVLHLDARTIAVNDIHRGIINLARVMADPLTGPMLYRRLRRRIFHPAELAEAQVCAESDSECGDLFGGAVEPDPLAWAEAYFVAVWMGRSGQAGTPGELRGSTAMRWEAGGGDSAVRYQNAVKSIPAWRRFMRRCTFTTMDFADFLAKCKDNPAHAIYCDPPFPDAGDAYTHPFNPDKQKRLAELLSGFSSCAVVCRFHDHPMIRDLYRDGWIWHTLDGRDQHNKETPEVLLTRNVPC